MFGGSGNTLTFGDGGELTIPELASQEIDASLHVGRVEFKTTHTYSGAGAYTISYTEENRNEGILNVESSINTPLTTETYIFIESSRCNSSPSLTVAPIDRACKGVVFFHNPGAVDPDDDSLSYQLVTPKQSPGDPVEGYASPTDQKFYGADFNHGNENKDGPPLISINPVDGTLTWDAPGAIGEYAIAIMVTEWKLNPLDTTWYKVGHVVRDMQIIVEDCQNQKPDLTVPESFCVIAGSPISFTAHASDPDNDDVVIEAFSDVFDFAESPAIVAPANGVLQSTKPPNDTAAVTFTWNTTCAHVKEQPYQLILKITDRPPSGPRLVKFKTVQIKVVAPAPQFESVSINPVTKQVVLQWADYECENVKTFQVWRRVAEYNYEQPQCDNGMPYYLRYKLLDELPFNASSYTDKNLAIGAQYCYRIVALVGNNKIPSRISLDTCIIPKPAEAPVITNVSVRETNISAGEILVRWTSPFDIDAIQYPPPYQYKVYRAEGITEGKTFELLTTVPITDTIFTDVNLNTAELPFQYKIELYVPAITDLPVDTSSVASSVRLLSIPQRNNITLTWEANTPWYNYTQKYPYHLIYRGENTGTEFLLIDSVDVNENGFVYTDNGEFQNAGLARGTEYYYKILTRGSYGNPRIHQPLENYSQISVTSLLDTIPPCPPIVSLKETDCRNFSCSGNNYFNTITWDNGTDNCATDVRAYEVYVSNDGNDGNDEFTLLTTVIENSFTHSNLISRSKCYKVKAIDHAGNESEFSEPVCSDNCPYFELPNVFSPGNNDEMNDFFTAFTENSDSTKCARFVMQVDLNIYDRWGREVYSKKSITPENNYILWEGLTNTGKEVSSGVYFYSANVTFDMRDPGQRRKQFKGWVHVLH